MVYVISGWINIFYPILIKRFGVFKTSKSSMISFKERSMIICFKMVWLKLISRFLKAKRIVAPAVIGEENEVPE